MRRAGHVVLLALCVASVLSFAVVLVLTAGSLRPGDQPSIRGAAVGAVASIAAAFALLRQRPRRGAVVLSGGLALTLGVAALPADGVPPGRGVQDLAVWLVPLGAASLLSWRVR